MDYVVPVILFALGFGGALVIRRLVNRFARRGRPADLQVKKGAVRLESVGKKKKRKK